MRSLDELVKAQEVVADLYENDDVIGISEDRIQFRIERFLGEFDEYDFCEYDGFVGEVEFHLHAEYNGLKFVAVFDRSDICLFDVLQNEELKHKIAQYYELEGVR